jgi:serine-type D-Ala-D-Ala carboxypeptidase/endopeptidase
MLARDDVAGTAQAVAQPFLSRLKRLCVAIAVRSRGRAETLGYGDWAAQVAPGDLVYEIGSITKVFTALLLAILVEDGIVRLDDPVGRYLPPEVVGTSRLGREVTLLHLATHTSGLPRLPGNLRLTPRTMANPYARYSVDDLYGFLAGFSLEGPLPAPHLYSNLGAGLLGHALAAVLRVTYEQAVRERICQPLGMRDTSIALRPDQAARLVPGHAANGRRAHNWDLPALAGAGALRSTAGDLARFLAASMEPESTPLTAAMRLCQEPRVEVAEDVAFGLGWVLSSTGGDTVTWHNGGTGGYNSYLGFSRARDLGVVVLTNYTVPARQGVRPQADAMGTDLLKALG